jgi:4-amino-4-deoxy-L-arabinose transferase-like glycosyltransferase
MRHRILLAAGFTYLCVVNLIWISHDTRPPFWDMANHQRFALRVHDSFGQHGMAALAAIPGLTDSYPPLYHSIVALFYGLFGTNFDAAAWANIPAILILLMATYGIGRRVYSPPLAATAAVLVNFYPLLIWLSRETLIDYWLTSLVALSIWLLLQTEGFSRKGWSVALGVCCALGMLTKWTFPFFVVLPYLWVARNRWKDAMTPVAVAFLLAAAWYIPALPLLRNFSAINAAGAQSEGDPSLVSGQALIFYWRALEGYQLFLPLFLAFVAGAALLARRFEYSWMPVVLWAAGGWLALLFFANKDPRYSAPLLPAVALITARIFENRSAALLVLFPFLIFQHYMVSFGIPQLPDSIVMVKGVEGPLSWNWNLYTQRYFGLWGPPAREDWRIDRVLDRVSAVEHPVKLGIVPDIPRFDSAAFNLTIALRRLPVVVHRISEVDEAAIAGSDYLIAGRDGTPTYSAPNTKSIHEYIRTHPQRFSEMESFALPNGEAVILYRVTNP